MSGHRARATPAAVLAVAALLLTACTSTADRVGDAIDQAVAATATGRLALELDADGSSFRTTAVTAARDARREAAAAARTVAELDAGDGIEAGRRVEALDALDGAVLALGAAVDALSGIGDPGDAADRVADAEAALRSLAHEGSP
ncbi:hypothetical protein [Agromyces sp. GXS1127]|uniref:hypothetical protein n=1 Tax=Agromyces sp. GXS1127 TaxID=3424181 RepID=UPI003D319BA3